MECGNNSCRPPVVIQSPCAACKILRRRCTEKCVLAPYFPPTDPWRFVTAHRVFGASNIIKLLQELPESQREDTVSSIVYEANARIRDPVYGTAGLIYQLQNQINELQAELAKTQAQLLNSQQAILTKPSHPPPPVPPPPTPCYYNAGCLSFDFDDRNFSPAWEPLWTRSENHEETSKFN